MPDVLEDFHQTLRRDEEVPGEINSDKLAGAGAGSKDLIRKVPEGGDGFLNLQLVPDENPVVAEKEHGDGSGDDDVSACVAFNS